MLAAKPLVLATALWSGLSYASEEACFPEYQFLGAPRVDEPYDLREVQFDHAVFYGDSTEESFTYDTHAALRPLTPTELKRAPDWVLATRLVLSEVGPDRLLDSEFGLLEAIGIVQSVHNRMHAAAWNPEGIPGLVPWPGCGPGGSFNTCANPAQYLGLRTPRALQPQRFMRNQERLLAATDTAITAWWLQQTQALPDITGGATSFVHRCGGAAYGERTMSCDGRGWDRPGANANTGPLVLKGPGPFSSRKGRYELVDTRTIDYRARASAPTPGAYARYLWGRVLDYASRFTEG